MLILKQDRNDPSPDTCVNHIILRWATVLWHLLDVGCAVWSWSTWSSAVEQLRTPDTGWGEAASEGCGKKFPPSDCKKLSILLFTTWQLIEIDNALHCFTFTRNLLLTFVFCPTYSTALGFFNLDITIILTKTLLQNSIKSGYLHLN